jgi:hypothetical protein
VRSNLEGGGTEGGGGSLCSAGRGLFKGVYDIGVMEMGVSVLRPHGGRWAAYVGGASR